MVIAEVGNRSRPLDAGAESALDPRDPVGSARELIAGAALATSTVGRVGLELEFHLVDRAEPRRRPSWDAVQGLLSGLPPMPGGSTVTCEPGGQLELSTPPHDDVVAAAVALRLDRDALRRSLSDAGLAGAPLGADPARPVERINPHQRYSAMERHYEALGYPGPGRAMMTATAALQINLDAGPERGWADRLAHIRALLPVLIAASSTSPYLAGLTSGWHSMRQQTWHGMDPARTDPVGPGDPAASWADYALAAPVMLIGDRGGLVPVVRRVTLAQWLRDPARLGRPATGADIDYHLTTLFPPIRPRGYIEIRCLDALPDRWWPAVVAIAVTLIDDPVAADAAAQSCAPVAHLWQSASQHGPADATLRTALMGCVEIAARHAPLALRSDVESFAELIRSGRTPCSELRASIDNHGPTRVLAVEADA